MASESSSYAGPQFLLEVVARAFVGEYYRILHVSPSHLLNFYQEASVLSRPDRFGRMSSVSGLQAINEVLQELKYCDHKIEVITIDAQLSFNGAIIVLVTGYDVSIGNVARKFTRTFFLATIATGYYVLNDIFRYVGEDDGQAGHGALPSGDSEPHAPGQETPQELDGQGIIASQVQIPKESVFAPPENEDAPAFEESPDVNVVEEILNSSHAAPPDPSSAILEVICDTRNDEDAARFEESPAVDILDQMLSGSQATSHDPGSAVLEGVYSPPEDEDVPPFQESSIVSVVDEILCSSQAALPDPSSSAVLSTRHSSPSILGEEPKKSHASTVQSMKENPAAPAVSSSVPYTPAVANIGTQTSEGVDYSIYVDNLPPNVTPAQLAEAFKKFGPIKPGGIRISSPQQHKYGFGYVKFEIASAVEAAIKASPIKIGDRQVFVEEKWSTNPKDNSGGCSGGPSVRGGGGN